MVRCKTCRVMLDIHPLQEKKYRCMGCKSVFSGSIYYKYGSKDNADSRYISSNSSNSVAQKTNQPSPNLEVPAADLMDFDLGDIENLIEEPASKDSGVVGITSDIFEDLSSMDFSTDEDPKKFVQGETHIQNADNSPENNFAPFKIIRQIAQGGMGIIYEAEHPQYGRVALKLLPNTDDIEDVDIQRFVREGEVLKNLAHPNIIPFYESGVLAKRHYIAMKFQEGMTLDRIISKRGKFTPQQVSEILIPLLSALEHAHNQNILHRDIKPENIIVDPTGVPMLMDFGIVKLLGEKETKKITAKGTTVGTPAYMPPEQAQGKKLAPACDVYSIGAVLYEMLSGNCPYTGNNAVEIMKNVVHQSLRPLSYHGNFPEEITWICETALEKSPEGRFQTAKEMETVLKAFIEGNKLINLKGMVPDRTHLVANRGKNKFSGLQKAARSGSRISAARSGTRSGTRPGARRPAASETPKKRSGLVLIFGATFFIFIGVGVAIFAMEFFKQKSLENSTDGNGTQTALNNTKTPDKENGTPENQEQLLNKIFFKASEAEQVRNYEAAEKFYIEILTYQPSNRKAKFRRCVALYHQNYIPQTLTQLDTYLMKYPNDWEAHQLKITCLKENKDSLSPFEHLFSLIEHLDQMRDLFPEKTHELSLMKGEAYEELAKQGNPQYFDQAVQIYQTLKAQQPNNAKVLTRLGNLYLRYLQQSDIATVVDCFTQAAQLEPNSPETQGNLGLAYILTNKIEQGVLLLEKALEYPKLPQASEINYLQFLTNSYFQIAEQTPKGENSEKVVNKYYRAVVRHGKELNRLLYEEKRQNIQIMMTIAQAYYKIGERKRAVEWFNNANDFYKKVLMARGEPPLILEKQAEFYFKIGSYTRAIRQLESVADIYGRSNQYEQKKRIDDLILEYKKEKARANGETFEEEPKKDESQTESKEDSSSNKLDELEKELNKEEKKEPKKEEDSNDTLDELEDLLKDGDNEEDK